MIYFHYIDKPNYYSPLWERLPSRDQHCRLSAASRLAPPENSGIQAQAKAAPTKHTSKKAIQ
jgi:hypothetical protein